MSKKLPSEVVITCAWCRLTYLLSTCSSLSGVRPTKIRPGSSAHSRIASPLYDSTSRALAAGWCTPVSSMIRCEDVGGVYSTHCSSATAAFTSSTPIVRRSFANAAIIAVSHSVFTSRGMPPA